MSLSVFLHKVASMKYEEINCSKDGTTCWNFIHLRDNRASTAVPSSQQYLSTSGWSVDFTIFTFVCNVFSSDRSIYFKTQDTSNYRHNGGNRFTDHWTNTFIYAARFFEYLCISLRVSDTGRLWRSNSYYNFITCTFCC